MTTVAFGFWLPTIFNEGRLTLIPLPNDYNPCFTFLGQFESLFLFSIFYSFSSANLHSPPPAQNTSLLHRTGFCTWQANLHCIGGKKRDYRWTQPQNEKIINIARLYSSEELNVWMVSHFSVSSQDSKLRTAPHRIINNPTGRNAKQLSIDWSHFRFYSQAYQSHLVQRKKLHNKRSSTHWLAVAWVIFIQSHKYITVHQFCKRNGRCQFLLTT